MQILFLLFSIFSFTHAQSYYSCPGATDHHVPTTCVSGFDQIDTLRTALNAVSPDLRVVSLNQYAWNAKQSGYATIRNFLREILPTTDIIAFQEMSEGDFESVNDFLQGDDFAGRSFHRLETSNFNPSLTIYATTEAQFSNGGLEPYGWDNFNRNRGWADGYQRFVTWSDVLINGKQLKVANNHGCLGHFSDGRCSTLDSSCTSGGSNGKFPNGGCKNTGGPAIIEKLRNEGFFENQGASSLFFCDCNNFSPPELLCVEGLNVRGRLNCGGPNLDFIAYGSNFELMAHYGFGGTARDGDSDHKSVVLDLRFRDGNPSTPVSSQPENGGTCGIVPERCDGHLAWALNTGRNSMPENYPNFEGVTGRALSDASLEDMQLYFYCENIQQADCRGAGLQPSCCGDVPCPCTATITTPEQPITSDCTSGFSNVKLTCGGCRVLTDSSSLHPTCNHFCSAQGRSCISAAEEVSNDCEILQTYDCNTDFRALGTSDALCECSATTTISQSTETLIPTENDPNCPTMGNANGLGFTLSTGLMETPISPTRVATIAKNANIQKFRLYGWDSDVEMVSAILSEIPDADFVVEITPTQVNSCATDENVCQEILQRYDEFSDAISYIAVGNEPLHAGRVTRFSNIPDAIANTARVLRALGWRARVSVPFSMSVLRDTYPASDAFFVEPSDPSAGNACDSGCITSSSNGAMSAILSSIKSQSGVFAIQAYPYFVASTEQSLLQASLDATQVMSNQVAATRVALGKLGFEDLPIIITEVGWPTDGTAVANPENAQAFLSSLADARRNPATSFFDTDVYAFELFDESRKFGASDEQHFGWFSEDGCKKFDISAPSSIPDMPCESNVPDTCSPHLDWAMSSGRFSSVASDYYPDFTVQTGVSLQDATREDMQLYFFCNTVQSSDCTGIAKPCTCSRQPCSCFGSTATLLASDVNSDTEATSDAGQDKNLIIMITIITLLLLICLIAICLYFCGTLKLYCTSKNFQIENDVDAKSHCELRL